MYPPYSNLNWGMVHLGLRVGAPAQEADRASCRAHEHLKFRVSGASYSELQPEPRDSCGSSMKSEFLQVPKISKP